MERDPTSEWQSILFSEAVPVNPPVQLQRGTENPFVDIASVNPGMRWAYAGRQRKHSGGGARFQDGDTLMARITPCLENGKIAFIAHYSLPKIVPEIPPPETRP